MSDNPSQKQISEQLLTLVRELLHEVHPRQAQPPRPELDSQLDRDLGLDSLARVELITRVEKHFQLSLPERSFAKVETLRDLLLALSSAGSTADGIGFVGESLAQSDGVIAPDEAQTLLDVLNWHVRHQPERAHIRLMQDAGDAIVISFRQLHQQALRVAGGLQRLGLQPQQTVSIMLPSGADYFYCYFGILLAGGVPVPIYPPARPSQLEDHLRRHARILDNCQCPILVTIPEARQIARLLHAQVLSLRHIATVESLTAQPVDAQILPVSAEDTAFIQYTSGSTGDPKGVVLSHANLLANIRSMGQAVQAAPDDVFVSWLPLYHDMGLIGAWLGSLYYAMQFVVMQPLSFLSRPEKWLWTIHHVRGTLSASPNFGYEYCLHRIDDSELEGLDLSCWRAAFNGAEPVSPQTLEDFIQRFKAHGFRREALMPVYGLAETSVGLTFPPLQRGPLIDRTERNRFMQSGWAEPARADDLHALQFVSSGSPLKNHQIRVVDAAGHELPERHQGQIQFQGPSSTKGYFRNPGKTRELFDGEWLNSGDLGYIAEGELYVSGRDKDIIIRAGRNIYPHELEQAVSDLAGIRSGRVAVFGSEDRHGTERLVVLAETRSTSSEQLDKLRNDINSLASDLIGGPADEVVLAPAGTVLKTSSGKIRRAASRQLYEQGDIGKHQRGVAMQLLRVALSSLPGLMRKILQGFERRLYAVWSWTVLLALAPLAWSGACLLPGPVLRWSCISRCARLLGKLTATPVQIDGLENFTAADGPCVVVANHASYIDAFLISATVPGPLAFVAKQELTRSRLLTIALKNIGTEFVDRFDTASGVEKTDHLTEVLKSGKRLMFFPEGAFTRAPGLLPFRLGAFMVAARAGADVIPVAIKGTRSILRGSTMFPQRGAIRVVIGKPIAAAEMQGESPNQIWSSAIELRNRSRQFILKYCGEPSLDSSADS